MKLTTIVTTIACALLLLAATEPPSFRVGQPYTNYTSYLIRTVEVRPIPTPCPQCGQSDHHEQRIDYMGRYGNIYLPVETTHGTNRNLVGTTATNYFLTTNVVPREQRSSQPGWRNPPAPPPLP